MNEILQIIGMACLGHLVVDFISSFDLPEIPEKPFKCEKCFTTWIAIIPFMLQFGPVGLLYACISGIISSFIYKYI